MDTRPAFVQFPHPAAEAAPKHDVLNWNRGDHRRKFLLSRGQYVTADGHSRHAKLAFWGEWEPPSRIVKRWAGHGPLPRALHQPYWVVPEHRGFRMNTDPWVFGERMLYSNCKQTTNMGRTTTAMQRLGRGSVICFGSTIDGQFCVDTVLVVASSERWTPRDAEDLRVDDAFRVCTVEASATAKRRVPFLTLYRGATFEEPVEGMFSFVPAKAADAGDPRFPRPGLHLPGFINPKNRRSTFGSTRPHSLNDVRAQWISARDQVLATGVVLAVQLETPPCEGTSSLPEEGSGEGCGTRPC